MSSEEVSAEIRRKENFLADFAELFELSRGELNESFVFQNHSLWDSLAIVSTIALIDEHFNLTIAGDKLKAMLSVGHLLQEIAVRAKAR